MPERADMVRVVIKAETSGPGVTSTLRHYDHSFPAARRCIRAISALQGMLDIS